MTRSKHSKNCWYTHITMRLVIADLLLMAFGMIFDCLLLFRPALWDFESPKINMSGSLLDLGAASPAGPTLAL